MSITFRMIRDSHRSENDTPMSEDDILLLKKLQLSDKNISKIDNLDLFQDLIDIDLSYNSISVIENLELLNKVWLRDSGDLVVFKYNIFL